MRKTKIICTLGPATEKPETLRQLIAKGADVFRLNMSHASAEWVRYGHAMAYDLAHNQMFMFGGATSATAVTAETTTWENSAWVSKTPQNSPPARSYHAVAYDSVRGEVVLFGGDGAPPGSPLLNDTWVWTGGGAATPVISSVVSASGFGGFASAAPGSWVEIYGSDFTTTLPRSWRSDDFNGNNAPTSLDGVQVTIGSLRAFIDYISSSQINAQLPSDIGTGPSQITVSNPTRSSAPFNIPVNAVQPGLLAPPSFKI